MTIHDFKVKSSAGQDIALKSYAGQVLLIVNTASKCGFTPQYEGLEKLNKEFADSGLQVIGFPSNQFKNQEPGTDEEIQEFCRMNYGVTFPVMAKIDVNGESAHPLYSHLTSEHGGPIEWNFTKFLFDRDGKFVQRFEPAETPADMDPVISKVLAGQS